MTTLVHDIVLSETQFRQVSDIVYEHCGINLHDGKKELVRARLAKRIRQCGFRTFEEYMDYVFKDKSGNQFSLMIDSVSTNLTSFFREIGHFEYLSDSFLPALIEKKSKLGSKRLRCWSAGCSSGEEPYSIAITLSEILPDANNWDAKILATDISTTVLERAKAGRYLPERIKPVPVTLKNRYLISHKDKAGHSYEVVAQLRKMILFKYLNLMQDWPIKGPVDFIFCRNVMIYFDKPTQEKLVNRFWQLLDHGGVLFTGHSESLTGIEHKFQYVRPTIYMKA